MKKIISLLSFVLFIACTDQLELPPPSSIAEEEFFSNTEEVGAGVIACYDAIQTTIQREFVLTEIRSDISTVIPGSGYEFIQIDKFTDDPTNGLIAAYWADAYAAIARANKVLGSLDNVTVDAKRKQYEGEASFIRGYLYFNLVRLFGGVPLITSTIGYDDDDKFAQASAEAVYAQIVTDLETAIADLSPTPDDGRAGAAAAQGLLAKVYLTRKEYGNARPLLEAIIESDDFELQPTYADVFSLANELNSEILFAIQFKALANGEGNTFSYEQSSKSPYGELNRPTVEMTAAYNTSGDALRKAVSITETGNRACIKYANTNNANDGDNDWPVLRYADILLMYAEVLNELDGPTQDALDYLNATRVRAGFTAFTTTDLPDEETFRAALYHERKMELAFENHGWFDLLRTGRALEVMNAHGDTEGFTVAEYQLLYPIPQREIDVSHGKLAQNPLYD